MWSERFKDELGSASAISRSPRSDLPPSGCGCIRSSKTAYGSLAGRPGYSPTCRDICCRAFWAGRAPANRTACNRPLGWSCRHRVVPDDGVFVRQPVLNERSLPRRDHLGDVGHHGDDAPCPAVLTGDSRGRSTDWGRDRKRTGGIITHA